MRQGWRGGGVNWANSGLPMALETKTVVYSMQGRENWWAGLCRYIPPSRPIYRSACFLCNLPDEIVTREKKTEINETLMLLPVLLLLCGPRVCCLYHTTLVQALGVVHKLGWQFTYWQSVRVVLDTISKREAVVLEMLGACTLGH